jgi:LmbE family N-acetylglucosaminyl deacetylase
VVRRHRPEIVITTNFRETYGGTLPNQADHIAVGRATLDGVRDAANRWVFQELLAEGHEPWNGVRQLWAVGSPDTRHAVDIKHRGHHQKLRAQKA